MTIFVEEHDGLHIVRLANGPVNVLDLEHLEELTAAFNGLAEADAVVLTGAGRTFSAGVDLRRILDGGRDYVAEFLPALSAALRAVFDHPRPVVAAVNGHAIAGGCVLAAACDRRLMSAGTIGVTELLVGVPFPAAVLGAVRFAVGPRTADLVLTGQRLSPAEALAVGLVDEVVEPDELLPRALDQARQLARIPAGTFTMTKRQLRRETTERIEADDRIDAGPVLEAWTSEPVRRAIRDYLDRLTARS
jgi:enoyl-CoA hydratase